MIIAIKVLLSAVLSMAACVYLIRQYALDDDVETFVVVLRVIFIIAAVSCFLASHIIIWTGLT